MVLHNSVKPFPIITPLPITYSTRPFARNKSKDWLILVFHNPVRAFTIFKPLSRSYSTSLIARNQLKGGLVSMTWYSVLRLSYSIPLQSLRCFPPYRYRPCLLYFRGFSGLLRAAADSCRAVDSCRAADKKNSAAKNV